MTRREHYELLDKLAHELRANTWECAECDCLTLERENGFNVIFERFTLAGADLPHECRCHAVSATSEEG